MLKTIIQREIIDSIKSAKFLIGFLMVLFLSSFSMIINVQDYQLRHQDYLRARTDLKSNNATVKVFRDPQVLGTLARGRDREMGDQIRLSITEAPRELSGYMDTIPKRNPSFLGFSAVDFAFIVRVILSLLIIFLAFDTISGEKNNGTLKLILSNSLPRDKLLLGKVIGGLISILFTLGISMLVTLSILIFDPRISLTSDDFVRIGGMFAISFLYLSLMYMVGLFVSVKTDNPAVSLMVILQVWIFIVIIYPNLSVVLAERFYRLPSDESLAQQKYAVSTKTTAETNEYRKNIQNNNASKEDWLKYITALSNESLEYDKIFQFISHLQTSQMRLAESISILSPATLYDKAMNRLARTDIREYDRFLDGVHRLWLAYIERSKLQYIDEDAFNKTSLPNFNYISDTPAEAISAVWLQFLLLAFLNIGFFFMAFKGFLRKDVR